MKKKKQNQTHPLNLAEAVTSGYRLYKDNFLNASQTVPAVCDIPPKCERQLSDKSSTVFQGSLAEALQHATLTSLQAYFLQGGMSNPFGFIFAYCSLQAFFLCQVFIVVNYQPIIIICLCLSCTSPFIRVQLLGGAKHQKFSLVSEKGRRKSRGPIQTSKVWQSNQINLKGYELF